MTTQPPTQQAWIRDNDWPPGIVWAVGLYSGLVVWLSLSVLLHVTGIYPTPAVAP